MVDQIYPLLVVNVIITYPLFEPVLSALKIQDAPNLSTSAAEQQILVKTYSLLIIIICYNLAGYGIR